MTAQRNPPAFPRPFSKGEDDWSQHAQEGMTLRDYFAAQALAGAMTDPGLRAGHTSKWIPEMGKYAYQIADAMLVARNLAPATIRDVVLLDVLEKLVNTIDNLIEQSSGVAGLHLNGDLAPWADLEAGGKFEDWLLGLDSARKAIATLKGTA